MGAVRGRPLPPGRDRRRQGPPCAKRFATLQVTQRRRPISPRSRAPADDDSRCRRFPDAGSPRSPRRKRTRQEADDDLPLRAWRPKDPAASLGLAVEFLSKKPAFARAEIRRLVASTSSIRSLADTFSLSSTTRSKGPRIPRLGANGSQALAEQSVEGRAGLQQRGVPRRRLRHCQRLRRRYGRRSRFIVDTMRKLFAGKRTLYFKRHYPDGRTRPTRLSVNDFVAGHAARAGRRGRAESSSGPCASSSLFAHPLETSFGAAAHAKTARPCARARP